MSLTDF